MTQEVLAAIKQVSFRSQQNYDKFKHTLQVTSCSNWMCTVLITNLTCCPCYKGTTGIETKEKPG